MRQLPAALQSQQVTLQLCLWLIQGESPLRKHSSEYSSMWGQEPLTRGTSHKIQLGQQSPDPAPVSLPYHSALDALQE